MAVTVQFVRGCRNVPREKTQTWRYKVTKYIHELWWLGKSTYTADIPICSNELHTYSNQPRV